MILGELCNFAGSFKLSPKSFDLDSQLTVVIAYAFVEAIVVVSSIPLFPRLVPAWSLVTNLGIPRLLLEPYPS